MLRWVQQRQQRVIQPQRHRKKTLLRGEMKSVYFCRRQRWTNWWLRQQIKIHIWNIMLLMKTMKMLSRLRLAPATSTTSPVMSRRDKTSRSERFWRPRLRFSTTASTGPRAR
ncbi:unnamed protein product [Amoebophrya sp. A120]|nr:unnamed protein product [Amoebophrya sp. A120]|eukprot:GSA120T00001411001.1